MPLSGKRILVVEDEPIIAFALEDMLIEDGADVVAVGSLEEGLDQAEAGVFDFAILDINLHGEKSYPIAFRLGSKARPSLPRAPALDRLSQRDYLPPHTLGVPMNPAQPERKLPV